MQEFDFVVPKTLAEACQMLSDGYGRPVAGCTDVLPQMRHGKLKTERLVDLSRIKSLAYIEHSNGRISIGALTTYEQMVTDRQLHDYAPVLAQAAATVGCRQTRNRGTLGGNLGNASPAGDTLPPLLILNAQVVLAGSSGERRMAVSDLLLAPGKTALLPDEIITSVGFEALPRGMRSLFLKLGNRQGMAVSVASVALALQLDGGGPVQDVRIALGAVAPTAIRCPEAEKFLIGQQIDPITAGAAGRLAAQACAPIDDVRASAAYRRHAIQVLVKRGLLSLSNDGDSHADN